MFQLKNKLPLSWIVFLLALAARCCHLFTSPDLFSNNPFLTGDAFEFDRNAFALGRTLSPSEASIYHIFLRFIYDSFGTQLFFPKIIQSLLGSLGCVLIYKIGKKIWNRKVGLIAGIITSLYGIFIFYDGVILKPSLGNFFLIMGFYLLTFSYKKPRWAPSLAALAFLMLAIPFREHLIIAPFAVGCWFLLRGIHQYRFKNLMLGVVFIFATLSPLLALLPTFQNALPQNQIVGVGGIHFYIGNQPNANGTYHAIPGVPNTAVGHYQTAKKIVKAALGHQPSYLETSEFWLNKGLNYIKEQPFAWLKLEGAKFFLIFNEYEIPHDGNYPYLRKQSPFLSLPLLSYGLICPLGLLGLGISLRRVNAGVGLLMLFSGLYILGLLLTFVTANFRLPLQIPMILFASCALWELVTIYKAKQWKTLLVSLTALLVLYSFVNYPTYLPKKDYEKMIKNETTHYALLQNIRPRS